MIEEGHYEARRMAANFALPELYAGCSPDPFEPVPRGPRGMI